MSAKIDQTIVNRKATPAGFKHPGLEYRPAIDGLRALAVLSVFIFHLNHSWLPGGFVGVDVFFVISGYLITSIIFKECQQNSFSVVKFYQRRIARIFPAFFTVGLATLVGSYFIYSPQDLASAGANLSAAALSLSNIKFMLQGNYFAISPDAQPYLHYWSLSVEEQFYIFFPLLFLLIFKHARKYQMQLLVGLCGASFITCVVLTRLKPVWAFYLLPTRSWELLAGCLLAILTGGTNSSAVPKSCWPKWVSGLGLGIIIVSFLLVREGPHFPGYWSILPTVGAVGVLMPLRGTRSISEKWLAVPPLVLLGRMSYSLYLWHWPVFSLVDYKMYLASAPARVAIKVGLSILAATLSFLFIENPARKFFNSPKHRRLAYSFMFLAIALCVPLGIAIRKSNYVNAETSDVTKGGLVFGSRNAAKSVVLMGDSNGSMYGKVLKEICAELGYKLTVISVAAGDPLPASDVSHGQLWLDSLAVVRKEKPDCLVLACSWEAKLKEDKQRLALAVDTLKPLVGRLVILNQPPILPAKATRAAIRDGARPPFFEDEEIRRLRLESNEYLERFNVAPASVVDIARYFQATNGEALFLDGQGRQLYHDAGHLSGFGADLIRSDLKRAISQPSPTLNRQ
ncbi:MAG: acyltransferase 3 [Verrucomicrobiales bacterium]|nr:acyltransferase 3 [Verrucomicrobiales bacterium]